MTESLTISPLSLKYFILYHYNIKNKPLPLIISQDLYKDLHEAYYGARVEVFKPYGCGAMRSNAEQCGAMRSNAEQCGARKFILL
jgi:hypothetical protein